MPSPSEERLFDHAPTPMAWVGHDGVVLAVNQRLAIELDRQPTDVVGRDVTDALSITEPVNFRAHWTTRRAQDQLITHTWSLAWGGRHRTVEVAGTVLADGVLLSFHPSPGGEAPVSALDSVTGLPGRDWFVERLELALHDRRRMARRVAVVMLDLDRLRDVNEGLGHRAGDRVLAEAGRRLNEVTRRSDTVARFAGDQFGILAREIETDADVMALVVNLRSSLSDPFWLDGSGIHVSSTVGLAMAPIDGTDSDTLTRKADVALARAKRLGVHWAVYAAEQDASRLDRVGLAGDLRAAIGAGDITVAYQPLISRTGVVAGLEALARWHHPTRGDIPPAQFIPLAEQSGVIDALTQHVLKTAAGQAVTWGEQGHQVGISINVSASLLRSRQWVSETREALEETGLDPARLTLEITETALADTGDAAVRAALADLRGVGVRISIDDFGTGYSSLAYLKQLDVDELKIDQSFVRDLDSDDRDVPIVRSLVQLARSLGLAVVAEGVESISSIGLLDELGCDLLQGYAISRPAPASDVTSWLEAHHAGATRPRTPPSAARSLRILVVDDDPVARRSLVGPLTDRGHHLFEAEDGPSALEAMANRPDFVVLDHHMPGMTGAEAAVAIRSAGYAGPVVLYTAAVSAAIRSIRVPLDVWPVTKSDEATLVDLIDGFAARPRAAPAV